MIPPSASSSPEVPECGPTARADPSHRPGGRSGGDRAALLDLVLVGLLFMGMAVISWRRWADLWVDFGQQLYVAWRLAEGEVLYRDVAYLHGPLPSYVNGSLFRIFGTGYTTLVAANLTLGAAMAALLYTTFRRGAGRLGGLTAALVFVSVFAFGQYVGIANFNWVSPYAHSATHGVFLFAVLAWLLTRPGRPGPGRSLAAGLLAGALLLTRADVAAPALAATALFLALSLARRTRRARAAGADASHPWHAVAAMGVAGLLLPPLVAAASFRLVMPTEAALQSALAAWTSVTETAGGFFFVRGAGLEDPLLSVQVTIVLAVSAVFTMGVPVAAAMTWRMEAMPRAGSALLAAGAVAFVTWAAATTFLADIGRGLPLLALVPAAAWGRDLWCSRGRVPVDRPAGATNGAETRGGGIDDPSPLFLDPSPLFLWALFGLAMLGKSFLNARIQHYGFYLSLAAVLCFAVFLVADLPRRVDRAGGSGLVVRAAAVLFLGVLAARYVEASWGHYRLKTAPVGDGRDVIVTWAPSIDPRTPWFQEALEHLRALPPDATVQVLPEGAMLNYLSRRTTGSRFTNFMPTELDAFGEHAILAELRSDPPDRIVLVHKDTAEYGVGYFGADPLYGASIMAWVRERYERELLLGAEPLQGPFPGIEVLRRAELGAGG